MQYGVPGLGYKQEVVGDLGHERNPSQVIRDSNWVGEGVPP